MKTKSLLDECRIAVNHNGETKMVTLRTVAYQTVSNSIVGVYKEIELGAKEISPETLDEFVECYLSTLNKYAKEFLRQMMNNEKEYQEGIIRALEWLNSNLAAEEPKSTHKVLKNGSLN